ncbi:MAG: DUF3592 domain-containing protein [Puniceicoccales bacterium]|jgi:hypothetical protein|nr:DUF3592 domain-containing protein [Puniceicoccales bacterium]
MSRPRLISPEELTQLLAAPAPRPVSWKLQRRLGVGYVPLTLFGAVFFLFGLPFLYIFFPWQIVNEWRLYREGAAQTEGRIIEAKETGGSENDVSVWSYGFSFKDSSGADVSGRCYHTGEKWQNGSHVTVRYLPGNPQIACIEGARMGEFSVFAGFVIIFPVSGVAMVVISLWLLRRKLRLVKYGKLGDFLITDMQETSVRINDQPQYKITLQPVDGSVTKPIVFKLHDYVEVKFARNRHERGERVFAFFNPHKPKHALLPEIWAL